MATESRLVTKWGNTYVEVRYKGKDWSGWLFPMSRTYKKNWIYVPELNVYRRNTSLL